MQPDSQKHVARLTLVLGLVMAIGPLARWSHAPVPELWTRLRWAFAVAVIAALILPWILGRWSALISIGHRSTLAAFHERRLDLGLARQSAGESRAQTFEMPVFARN